MADLQYSPRDPVFYAHHSNIDRLWSSWVAAGHTNPDFGQAKVYFYDETRTWRYVLMNDLKDESQLGYRYSALMQPAAPVKTLQTFALDKSGNLFVLAPASLGAVRANASGPHFLIIQGIQNLDQLPAETVQYGIFTRAPAAGTQATAENGYIGQVSTVKSGDHQHVGPLSGALNITGKLATVLADEKGSVNLYVAPLDKATGTSGPGIPLIADRVSIVG
jgi:polyphenol oxidase